MANDERALPSRVSAAELGPPFTVTVASSWAVAATALLPAMDGDLLPGQEALAAIPDWRIVRTFLIHGLALRNWMAATWVQGHPLPESLHAWDQWASRRDEPFWRTLLARGAKEGLAYYDEHMDPVFEAETRRKLWPRPIPDLAEMLDNPVLWKDVVLTQSLTWGVPPEDAHDLLSDWGRLDRAVEWALRTVMEFFSEPVPSRWPYPMVATKAVEAIERFTGRPVPGEVRNLLAEVGYLVIVPTAGLGPHLISEEIEGTWVLWAEPNPGTDSEPATPDIRPIFAALASPVGYRIVEILTEGKPRPAHELAEMLKLHPSTISRNLKDLTDTGIVTADPLGGRVVYRLQPESIRRAMDWLSRCARPYARQKVGF